MAQDAALQRRLSRYMREHGLKNTRQRQMIIDVFLGTDEHMAIDELLSEVQRNMPGVGYATVYRTMKLLSEAGVAQERRFGDGQTRYEPATIGEHHDHLICATCGHIFEFEDPVIEDRQREIATARGLRIVSHRHDIIGECQTPESCAWREARESRGR